MPQPIAPPSAAGDEDADEREDQEPAARAIGMRGRRRLRHGGIVTGAPSRETDRRCPTSTTGPWPAVSSRRLRRRAARAQPAARRLRGLEHARRRDRRRRRVAARGPDTRSRGRDRARACASGADRCTKCTPLAPDMGWRMRCEVHLAVAFDGELHVDDPDGIVVEAAFVPARRMRRPARVVRAVGARAAVRVAHRTLGAAIGRRVLLRGAAAPTATRCGSSRERLIATSDARRSRSILHVDLDAFYASVEQLDDPELRGQAGRSSAAPGTAASSAPRATKPGSSACTRRCRPRGLAAPAPQAVFLPPRFDRYSEKSREVMAILESVTPLVEQLSIDEAFLDAGGVRRRLGTGEEVARAAPRADRARRPGSPRRSASRRRSSSPSSRATWRSPTACSSSPPAPRSRSSTRCR